MASTASEDATANSQHISTENVRSISNAEPGSESVFVMESSTKENSSMMEEDVITFPSTCPSCQQSSETNIGQVNIPHFKQVVLMTLLCDCGYRTTEVKPAGDIANHGTKLTLRIQSEEDLKRDVILSDTAGIAIPEIELELQEGMGEGIYTTVEGLIKRMLHQLTLSNPFVDDNYAKSHNSSYDSESIAAKYRHFLTELNDIGDGKILPATLVINDPLSNSFIGRPLGVAMSLMGGAHIEGSFDRDNYSDNGLAIQVYDRTEEQNEALGLNHVKTEGYELESSEPKSN